MMQADIVVVGGGAAGIATAIFAARNAPGARILLLDGAKKLGAKILVSGGGRCNVTNTVVTPKDYWGGSRHVIKRVLAALPVEQTVTFFRAIGVTLHEEEHGKLFPDTNSARTVLDALVRETRKCGVQILTEHRVGGVVRCQKRAGRPHSPSGAESTSFEVTTNAGIIHCRTLVLATGGKSLPKTGSDGGGYEIARSLGHSIVPTTPALAPLLLDGDFHRPLSGLTQDVEIALHVKGEKPVQIAGSMLWTHFGVSGPVVLDASRVWHRAKLENRPVEINVNLLPGESFDSAERRLLELALAQPKSHLQNVLHAMLPARLTEAILTKIGISAKTQMAHLPREDRRKLLRALTAWPLPVRDSRGYAYAEVTAGGVPLSEIDAGTMQSRICPGLFLVGEILDVDGRIGGFNFQWAWSSAFVAGQALAKAIRRDSA